MSAGELSTLEQLFSLSGYDVSALLASGAHHSGGGGGAPGASVAQQQLVHDQAGLGWGASALSQQSLLQVRRLWEASAQAGLASARCRGSHNNQGEHRVALRATHTDTTDAVAAGPGVP